MWFMIVPILVSAVSLGLGVAIIAFAKPFADHSAKQAPKTIALYRRYQWPGIVPQSTSFYLWSYRIVGVFAVALGTIGIYLVLTTFM